LLLVEQFMMQIKFNFNTFYFMACLPELGSVPAAYVTLSSLAAVIGRCRLQ